jgi:hypothetical protein
MGHAALSHLLTMAASVQAAESTDSSIAPANYRFEASGPAKLSAVPATLCKLFRCARTNTCSRAKSGSMERTSRLPHCASSSE